MAFVPRINDRIRQIKLRRAAAALVALIMLAPMVVLSARSADAQGNTPFTAISFGSTWSYLDDGSNQGTAWQTVGFDDSGWATGAAELGYGDGDETTVVSFGPSSSNKYRTTYFRTQVTVPAGVQSAQLRVVRDDGVVVHINGVEAARNNMPASYNYLTAASSVIAGSAEDTPVTMTVSPAAFQPGLNTIAVEIHQISSNSSDISFNLELTGVASGSTDTEAPSVPTGLTATDATPSSIDLSWTGSTDNVAVQSYRVYRDSTLIGFVSHPSTTFVDTGLTSSTGYTYQVSAVDLAGNESALSASAFASTLSTLDLSEIADDTWQTNGTVNVVLPIGDNVYIGGEFTELNDGNGNTVVRNNLAAIDRLTGAPTSFNPNMNRKVFALTPSPDASTLYVGGAFTTAEGVNRKRVAAFDVATGALSSFNPPSPNKAVRSLSTDGTRLFIGGLFDKVGGIQRVRLAAYDIATETLDPTWTPSSDSSVKAMILDPTKLWIAGSFDFINGSYAEGMAAVDLVSGALLPTDHPGIPIVDIAALGDQLFLAGAGPGGTAAAYNRTTGVEQWSMRADGNVQGVAALGNYAYFGGHYERMGGISVGRVERHDLATGAIDTNWLPTANGSRGVNDIAAEGFSVYLGGDFSFVSGEPHQGFAMFSDAPPGQIPPELQTLTMLDTDENGYVDTIEASFDKQLAACSAPCTDGWTLTDVPSGGTLSSVSTSGTAATLQLTEGSGDQDTAVGNLLVQLSLGSQIEDLSGNPASFPATEPVDGASPVPTLIRKTNAGTSGLAEFGDTLAIKWSEKIEPASVPTATDVVISDPDVASNDQLTINGFMSGDMDLGADDFLVCGGCTDLRQVVFTNSPVTMSSGNRLMTVTLSGCSGDCSELTAGSKTTLTYVSPSSITDLEGNGAAGSIEKNFKLF